MAVDFTRDTSPDRSGLQPDWSPELYQVLAEEAEKLGLEPGARWKHFPDHGHVQILNAPSLRVLKDAYALGGMKACWALLP
jgi:hypothetical protein